MGKARPLNPSGYKKDQLIRKYVFERDNFTCQICGVAPIEIPENYTGRNTVGLPEHSHLVVDHIIPWKRGGTIDLENLQTLCNDCNLRKGQLTDEEFRKHVCQIEL